MKRVTWIFFLAGLALTAHAELANPEDLLFEDLFVPKASFLRLGGLVGTGGLWAGEVEAGTEVASRTTLSVMAARSQLNTAATNELWVNGFTAARGGMAGGLSALVGYGPSNERYYGGLVSLAVPWDNFRFKVQSGLVHFEVPAISVSGSPLRTEQFPVRGEVAYWADPSFQIAAGFGNYFYTVDRTALASVLGTTTQTTGVGILSGFPLNQFYLRSEFFPAPKLMGALALSSALSAYQTNRVFSLSAKLEGEIAADWVLGAEVSLSRTGLRQWNFAIGPTLFVAW